MVSQSEYQELLKRLDAAEKNARIARDWVEISNLHGRYNHLALGHYWEKICDELFAQKTPGVKAELGESGVFCGIEGVRRVFIDVLGKLYTYEGNCAVHELTTPVIQIQEDGNTAKGMWLHLGANTFKDPEKGVIAIWQCMKYNQKFVREDGKWKFLEFRAHLVFRTSYDKGWVEEPVILGSTVKGQKEEEMIRADEPTSFHQPYPGKKGHYAGLPLPPEFVDL